jgi:hypothetical protein
VVDKHNEGGLLLAFRMTHAWPLDDSNRLAIKYGLPSEKFENWFVFSLMFVSRE